MSINIRIRQLFVFFSFLVVYLFFLRCEVTEAEEITSINIITEEETITKEVETTKQQVIKRGFIKENDVTYYYLCNGLKAKGFLNIDDETYYFDSNGAMVAGFKTINHKKYHFDKNGIMSIGFAKIGKHRYFFNSKGIMHRGIKRIKGNKYFFKKNGKMFKGFRWRKVRKRKIMNYFGKKGKLKTGRFRVGKVTYKAKKRTGEIYYVRNRAPVICQRPQLPTGCEITAWTMMVKHAGKKMNKRKAARKMPRSWNPNYGFVGSPYSSYGRGLIIYPHGLSGITKKYLGKYKNMTGCSRRRIRRKLRHKHLVLVWLCGLNGFGSHTVALTGYDKHHFFYNNPWTGRKEKIKYKYFEYMWRSNRKRALSY